MQLPEPPGLIHRRQVVETGIELHIVERPGKGTPVVLLHGIWGSWRAWLSLLALDPDPFGGRPLVLVDLRGHGASGKPPRGYGLNDYAADVTDLLLTYDQPVVVCGHSLGALTALAVARSVPDRIAALVLEEPTLPLPNGPDNLDPVWSNFAEAVVNLSMLKHQPLDVIVANLMEHDPDLPRDAAEEAAVSLSNTADGVFTAVMRGEFDGLNLTEPPLAVDCPVLVFQGENPDDRMLTDVGVAMLRGILPRLDLVTIPGTGHSVHAAAPAAFGAVVAGFLPGDPR